MVAVRRDRVAVGGAVLPAARADRAGLRAGDLRLLGHPGDHSGFAMLFRFGIMPMFLFSGTFFPVEPAARLARAGRLADPAVARGRPVPRPGPRPAVGSGPPLVHVGYLSLWAVVGFVVALALRAAAGRRERGRRSRCASRRPVSARRLVGTGGARYLDRAQRAGLPRGWLVLLSGIFEPLFYLLSIGVGVAQLVGDVELPGGELVAYTAFIAPGDARGERDERRDLRRDVQPVLQAEVQQAVRRRARDAGDARSTSPSARSAGR